MPTAANFASPPFFTRLKSYFQPVVLERRSSHYNSDLVVVLERGRVRLDARTVNYSFGALHEVLREAFLQLNIAPRSLNAVLLLGFGGGSAVELLRDRLAPGGAFTAVEIDPVVIELAHHYFSSASDPRLNLQCADALDYLQKETQQFDLIVADLFLDEITPAHVATPEFLRAAAARLRPGGALLYNRLANQVRRQAATLEFRDVFTDTFPESRELAARGNLVFYYKKPGI